MENDELKGKYMLPSAVVFTSDMVVKGVHNKTSRTLYLGIEKDAWTEEPVFVIFEDEENGLYRIDKEPKMIVSYIGDGKGERDIPSKPPEGSIVQGYSDGNIIIASCDGVRYEFPVPYVDNFTLKVKSK